MNKLLKKQEKKSGQVFKGLVVAAKLPQTVTVAIEQEKIHPLYHKRFKRTRKYLVHDEIGVSEGDVVEIIKVRPISKNKHFRVLRVIGRDIEAMVAEKLKEEAKEVIAEVMPEEKEEESSKEVSKEKKVLKISKVKARKEKNGSA